MKKITVVGAGKMGLGITQFFALKNYSVQLIETNEETAKKAKYHIEKEMTEVFNNDNNLKITEILKNIRVSNDLKDARLSYIVIEATPEILDLKKDLFSKLENICDENTIFATNTSGLSINSIAEGLINKKRFLGAHFFMPASIIPLVEVVLGDYTNPELGNEVVDFLNTNGKEAVLINQDIPGFIANRIQHAMAREAISLLEKNIATAKDIDTVVKWSIGIRMLNTGPLEQRDINGIDIHTDIANYLYENLENRITPSPLLLQKVDKGEIGLKSNKGFYNWDESTKYEKIKDKNEFLIHLINFINQEDNKNESNYKR